MHYLHKGKVVEADGEGFLTDIQQWDEELALQIAQEEMITMNEDRWNVVNFLRNYYMEYHITPGMRVLCRAIADAMGEDRGNSKFLYQLFPGGPVRQASKIAGLPQPTSCV